MGTGHETSGLAGVLLPECEIDIIGGNVNPVEVEITHTPAKREYREYTPETMQIRWGDKLIPRSGLYYGTLD